VDTTADCGPAAPPLLVRRATLAGERDVAALLRDVPVDPVEVADLMRRHWVLVLSDLTLPPTAPVIAVAAFRLDQPTATAHLAGIAVRLHLRRRGLGHRLLTGALTSLRAEGFERVLAFPPPDGAGASLLASAGFIDDCALDPTALAAGRGRLILLL
jgi:ribosomal protein S18 acetylase RimI-like enzyme